MAQSIKIGFRVASVCMILFFTSCGVDIQPGSQLAGQRCFFPSDCATGLTCYQRTCTPIAGTSQNNTNNQNNQNNISDAGTDVTEFDVTFDIGIDLGGNCDDGQRLCVNESTRAICIDEEWIIDPCGQGEFCAQGDCVDVNMCTDRDGDGYGNGCERGADCDDRDPNVNPGERENCNTPYDDNCNMRVNEDCELCCPGGCNDNEFCNATCACEPFDPDICVAQNQPCNDEGAFNNGFFCFSVDGASTPRCYGICDKLSANPAATCPEPGSVCTFGGDQQGICFSGCNFTQGCGEPGMGCLPYGSSPTDGMCIPTTNNQLGQPCNPDQFFDCAEGALCVDFGGPAGPRCQPACRPFEFTPGPGTDCGMGQHCLGFSSDIGLCRDDNNSFEGDQCSPQFTTCNADAVGCYPGGGPGASCQRLCRLAEGDRDCDNNWTCFQFDQQQDEIGVCAPQF